MKCGDVYYNYAGLKMTVVEYKDSHNVKIAFENGYEKYCCARDIRLGKVKNPYHPSIYGVEQTLSFSDSGAETMDDVIQNIKDLQENLSDLV